MPPLQGFDDFWAHEPRASLADSLCPGLLSFAPLEHRSGVAALRFIRQIAERGRGMPALPFRSPACLPLVCLARVLFDQHAGAAHLIKGVLPDAGLQVDGAAAGLDDV